MRDAEAVDWHISELEMVQTTLTQKFKRADTKEEEEDPNFQQSDPHDEASNPQNFVTPRFQRRVTHQSSEDESPSQSTIEVLPSSQEDEGEELDETAVNLTHEEIFNFTQKWDILSQVEEDDEDIPENEPPPIDFSQQPEDDEEDDDSNHQRGPKRACYHEPQVSSVIQKLPVDSKDERHLVVGSEWKIFRKGETFYIGPEINISQPEVVYTIKGFFDDPKVGKMAICQVAILAQKTFIGKGNPAFNVKAFEKKFQSKYVGLRYSQNKPLRKLVWMGNKSVDPQVFFDPPTKKTKGPGWTNAFSFTQEFGTKETCVIAEAPKALDGFAGGGGMSIALEEAGFKVT